MAYANFTIVLPTSGQVQWGGVLNTALQTIADQLDSFIGADSIKIQSDLDLRGFALLDIRNLRFSETTDPGVALNQWWDTNGELWVRDGANNPIQITSGGSINLVGTGGIGGNYVSANALVTYSSALNRYTFLTAASGGSAADLDGGNVRLRQGTNANAVILKAPTGLGADVNLTFPGSLPTTRVLVNVDATGSVTFNEALTTDSRGVMLSGTVTHVGATTLSGTMAHTTRVVAWHPQDGWQTHGVTPAQTNDNGLVFPGTSLITWRVPLTGLHVGDRLTTLAFAGTAFGSGLTGTLKVQSPSGMNTLGGSVFLTVGVKEINVTLGTPFILTPASGALSLEVAGNDSGILAYVSGTYDHPTGRF